MPGPAALISDVLRIPLHISGQSLFQLWLSIRVLYTPIYTSIYLIFRFLNLILLLLSLSKHRSTTPTSVECVVHTRQDRDRERAVTALCCYALDRAALRLCSVEGEAGPWLLVIPPCWVGWLCMSVCGTVLLFYYCVVVGGGSSGVFLFPALGLRCYNLPRAAHPCRKSMQYLLR